MGGEHWSLTFWNDSPLHIHKAEDHKEQTRLGIAASTWGECKQDPFSPTGTHHCLKKPISMEARPTLTSSRSPPLAPACWLICIHGSWHQFPPTWTRRPVQESNTMRHIQMSCIVGHNVLNKMDWWQIVSAPTNLLKPLLRSIHDLLEHILIFLQDIFDNVYIEGKKEKVSHWYMKHKHVC